MPFLGPCIGPPPIGIAPIRAMAEGFVPAPGSFDLVYRTPDPMDVALRSELEQAFAIACTPSRSSTTS